MPEFLVELYVSRAEAETVELTSERARAAAAQLTGEGTSVHYLRSIYVPEDETCFHLFEGSSADAVREAARRAGLRVERLSETKGARA
jgi:hypothetical protein